MNRRIYAFIGILILLSISTIFSQSKQSISNTVGLVTNTQSASDKALNDLMIEATNNLPNTQSFSVRQTFEDGGEFMWPILILLAFGLAYVVERFIYFGKAKLGNREFIDMLDRTLKEEPLQKAIELCEKEDNKVSHIILKGMKLRHLGYERVEKDLVVAATTEVTFLERRINIISAVANIAPTLGFLGTVVGMVLAFNDIAAADQVSAKIVAVGIKQALLTTAFGLITAIPMLLFYNYFVSRIEGFTANVEKISTDLIEKLLKETQSENSAS